MLDTDKCTCVWAFLKPEVGWTKFSFGLLACIGREKGLRDKEEAQRLYLQVKSEVESCISYLKEKREEDPYRSILSRLLYQALHGPNAEIPTSEPWNVRLREYQLFILFLLVFLSTKLLVTIVLKRIRMTGFIIAHSKHIEDNRIQVIAHECKCVSTAAEVFIFGSYHCKKRMGSSQEEKWRIIRSCLDPSRF